MSAGAYSLEVVNTITGCTTIYPYAINVENTCEILANGIDDDGDGDTDCDDSEHYAVIRFLDVLRASKQVEDGIIEVEADGQELSFVLEGTYELVLGDIRTLNLENTTGSFTDLPPGHYKLTVINGISMCTTEREIDLYRLEEICGNGLDDNGDGDMDCDDIQCLTEMIEEIQNCDDIECVTEMIEEIQKKNTKMDDDFCFSAEEVDILNLTLERDMRASKRVETVGFIPGEVTGDCGESAYFIAPNGRLIDHSKIHKIHIISPTSPFYKHLKYFVVGIETEEGEYYQAVYSDITIGPTDLIEIRDFKGYYKYDREKKQFDGFLFFRHELEDNIYLDNDQLPADAMAILHPGSKCYLESYCLNNWNLDETSMIESQDFILNKIRDLGRAPKLIEFCGPDPGENEYELQDILVFVNGYRLGEPVEAYNLLALDDYLSQLERGQQPRFNNVFFADVMAYWNLNGQFKSRLKPETTLYVDGHNDISTSNHRTSAKFTASLLTSKAVDALVLHNDNPNDQGFVDRKNAGEIAGIAILDMILDGRIPTSRTGNKINQKIDIVAHSFGYAHALGLYQAIKETASVVDIEIDFGRFYILAPENAGTDSGEFMLTDFDQVWQYGSKRDRPNPLSGEDPASKQDGVAVQRGIKDLLEFGELEPNRNLYGRSFIPNDDDFPDKVDVPRGFLESHYESNYLWMFTHLDNEDQDGYINPK